MNVSTKIKSIFAILLVSNVLASCSNLFEGKKEIKNIFEDVEMQQIYTHQYNRNAVKLISYLKNKDEKYRLFAAQALASVQDSSVLSDLVAAIKLEKQPNIRAAMAYSIGQMYCTQAQAALQALFLTEKNKWVRSQLLESLGKCATSKTINFYEKIPLLPTDTAECLGVAWGIYRGSLRSFTSQQATATCIQLIANQYPDTVRYAASCYLARTKKIDLSTYSHEIFSAFIISEKQNNVDININLCKALGKVNTTNAQRLLCVVVKGNYDYRMRVNALIALKNYDYANTRACFLGAAQSPNAQISTQASEILQEKAQVFDADTLLKIAVNQKNIRCKSTLLGTSLHLMKNDSLTKFIAKQIAAATTSYQKAYWIKALANDGSQYKLIADLALQANDFVVKTAAFEALLNQFERHQTPEKSVFAAFLKQILATNDVALVATAAVGIRNPELSLKPFFETETALSELKNVQKKLKLPAEAEAYLELAQTIAFLENKPYVKPEMSQFAPLNFEVIKGIKPNKILKINTEKGVITIRLLVNDAPATVAYFLELVKNDFYKKGSVHRLVPNFVAQAGCPRGDGYGSPNLLIKSELGSLHYLEGSMGMASAGKDTESSQWFFTHGFMPHLDGRYTIFAQVIHGFDAMHQLEVGDRIYSYQLEN